MFSSSSLRGGHSTGKRFAVATHSAHTGIRVVQQTSHRDWTLTVEHHSVGLTLRRDQYHIHIQDEQAGQEEYLRGYPSVASALQAARRRIDFVVDIQRPRLPRPRRRTAVRPAAQE